MVMLATVTISGCSLFSDNYYVTLQSNPVGAAVICNGDYIGEAPVNLVYSRQQLDTNPIISTGCKAKWVSGATKKFQKTYDTRNYPNGILEVVQHPAKHKGLNKAIAYGNQINYVNNQRRHQAYMEYLEYERTRPRTYKTRCNSNLSGYASNYGYGTRMSGNSNTDCYTTSY
ncbi:hypothetical protein V757_01940 [Pelistega indica]|uniref:PEGA domain-containing protein n=2 Tax=Pelistega indica TaxID=1414851 RepID=V8G8G2_9BURK|nr:hypothetical protein V757_01940 [Pelistega indica]